MSKPLGHKAYGSIPHVVGSKRGEGDHGLSEQQSAQLLSTTQPKDRRVWVQEKWDGSCVAVAKIEGEIVALGRAGHDAASSPYLHIRAFVPWVEEHRTQLDQLLDEGDRVVGEWMLMTTSVLYEAANPTAMFIAFDIMRGTQRECVPDVEYRVDKAGLFRIESHEWSPPSRWRYRPLHPIDQPEGLVYRMERMVHKSVTARRALSVGYRGWEHAFLGKWVRPDFEPGKYLKGPPQWITTRSFDVGRYLDAAPPPTPKVCANDPTHEATSMEAGMPQE